MSPMGCFTWYELRTTDLEAARAFYAAVAGFEVVQSRDVSTWQRGTQCVGGLVELPERARSQGAPAHWLGHIRVDDVAAEVTRWTALGAQLLGPLRHEHDGKIAVLKDPEGAVLALSSCARLADAEAIVWHELHTTERARAWSLYSEPFGWTETETLQLGPPVGAYQMFAFRDGDRSIGAMADTARAPHVHTHWLFYLSIEDLELALTRVRALGGTVIAGPMRVPSGDRVAQCEDPQGAVFGLSQRA